MKRSLLCLFVAISWACGALAPALAQYRRPEPEWVQRSRTERAERAQRRTEQREQKREQEEQQRRQREEQSRAIGEAARAREEERMAARRAEEQRGKDLLEAADRERRAELRALGTGAAADVKKADANKVDRTIFGIRVGERINIPECQGTRIPHGHACIQSSDDDAHLDGEYGVLLDRDRIPDWVDGLGDQIRISLHRGGIEARLSDGVVTGVFINAVDTPEFEQSMTEKYGKRLLRTKERVYRNAYGKAWTAKEREWKFPGLHVHFRLAAQQDDEGRDGTLAIETESAYQSKKVVADTEKARVLKP